MIWGQLGEKYIKTFSCLQILPIFFVMKTERQDTLAFAAEWVFSAKRYPTAGKNSTKEERQAYCLVEGILHRETHRKDKRRVFIKNLATYVLECEENDIEPDTEKMESLVSIFRQHVPISIPIPPSPVQEFQNPIRENHEGEDPHSTHEIHTAAPPITMAVDSGPPTPKNPLVERSPISMEASSLSSTHTQESNMGILPSAKSTQETSDGNTKTPKTELLEERQC